MKPHGDNHAGKPQENTDSHLAVRPLVRYVDESQAVLDAHISLGPWWDNARDNTHPDPHDDHQPLDGPVQVKIRMAAHTGPSSENTFEHTVALDLDDHTGVVRFEVTDPARWWPAGMGDQTLYDLEVTVSIEDRAVDHYHATVGLTSVRPASSEQPHPDQPHLAQPWPDGHTVLLVNGREREIQSVVPVDPVDEQHLLPVGGDSLLLVRGHFGSDQLYQAADRAGILLIQSVPPINANRKKSPAPTLQQQVDRLAGHPCLAGWLIQPQSPKANHLATQLHQLDPTRSIFQTNLTD